MHKTLIVIAMFVFASVAHAATEPVHFGLFGDVHTAIPNGEPKRTAILISDKNGWDARAESLAVALAADGTLVFGIDLPFYLKQMISIKDQCSLPSAHVQEMSDWMQRHQNLKNFSYPLLIGDGAGATFAYAIDAQAPKGTFNGLVTLGWDFSFRLPKPLCDGDAGKITNADSDNIFRIGPVANLPNRWLPLPFADGSHRDDALGSLQKLFPVLQDSTKSSGIGHELATDVERFTAPTESVANLPDDVADLPLVEVLQQGNFANRVAIVLTGDGGWAGLDVAVAEQLSKRGIAVVGLNTLKFFWHTRTPEEAADAVTRIVGHYGVQHPDCDFVVIGYSFGAALAPVVINRLPDSARSRIVAQVLISPDAEAVFEIHVGDWFGSTQHEGAIPIAPEIARTKVPVICVRGDEEGAESFCAAIEKKPNVRIVELPGGHHYNGDYDKLGASVAGSLPARK